MRALFEITRERVQQILTSVNSKLKFLVLNGLRALLELGAKSKPARLKGTGMRHPNTYGALRLRHPSIKVIMRCLDSEVKVRYEFG